MLQRVDIVKAELSHIPRIAEIESESIPGGWSEKAFKEALENKNAMIFAAMSEMEVVGFLNGSFVLDEGELLNIAVSEKYRKLKVGCALMERFFEELKKLGVNVVFLEVREGNVAARKLYEKYGFEQSGLRKGYYSNPEEDAVLMTKNI